MTSNLNRTAKAEAVLKQMLRDALRGDCVVPTCEETKLRLSPYADVLSWDMITRCMDEWYHRPIWFDDDTKEVVFVDLDAVHCCLSGMFGSYLHEQFRYLPKSSLWGIAGTGRADLVTPAPNKQPNASFHPRPYPDKSLANAHLVRIQPSGLNEGRPWATLVVEIGTSETVTEIPGHRAKYLGHKTGVNVYVAIAYNKSPDGDTANDTWWVSVAKRDITAPPAAPNDPPEYPPCILVGQTADGPPYTPVSVAVPLVIEVESALLWYPQPPPQNAPPTIKIDCNDYRNIIITE